MASPTPNDEEPIETTPAEEQAHAQDEENLSIAKKSKARDEFVEIIFDKKVWNHCCKKKYLKSSSGCTVQLNQHLMACPR